MRDRPEWFSPCSDLSPASEQSSQSSASQKGEGSSLATPKDRKAIVEPTLHNADAQQRKEMPMGTGLLDYFPDALAYVAGISYAGNKQHNPGQPLHHARGKSTDHADCIVRHFVGRGTLDTDGKRHSGKLAWRALALLQEELERELGVPLPRGAKVAS